MGEGLINFQRLRWRKYLRMLVLNRCLNETRSGFCFDIKNLAENDMAFFDIFFAF